MTPLYSRELLRLALRLADQPRLDGAPLTGEARSRTCGSRVVADLELDETGRVRRYGQQVNACAVGQAAAAIVGSHIVGRDGPALAEARADFAQWLGGQEPAPSWPELHILADVRALPARHPAALLAFDAALAALAQAESASRKAATSVS